MLSPHPEKWGGDASPPIPHRLTPVMSSKPEDMYRPRFLRSILAAKCGADTFVCGRVCAEMKKSTVYTVDVKLDVCGVVQESQCKCGAGMGPEAHCKHVCVIL